MIIELISFITTNFNTYKNFSLFTGIIFDIFMLLPL